MHVIAFQVDGTPAPKGSTRAFIGYKRGRGYRAIVTADNRRTAPWSARVREAAKVARHEWIKARGLGLGAVLGVVYPRFEPVRVEMEFVLPRVSRLPRTRIVPHTCKPDLDKLTRAVADALTGVLWADDAQVSALIVTKRYAMAGERPGCAIGVDRLAPIVEAAQCPT